MCWKRADNRSFLEFSEVSESEKKISILLQNISVSHKMCSFEMGWSCESQKKVFNSFSELITKNWEQNYLNKMRVYSCWLYQLNPNIVFSDEDGDSHGSLQHSFLRVPVGLSGRSSPSVASMGSEPESCIDDTRYMTDDDDPIGTLFLYFFCRWESLKALGGRNIQK